MEIVIKRRGNAQPQSKVRHTSPPSAARYGAWGRVEAVHSEDHSVDIIFDTGLFRKNIPVASREWVMSGDDYATGARDLPPADARVFVFMPYGGYDGCFVLCSGFAVTDKEQEEAFLSGGQEKIRKRVAPGNWKEEYHYATGTYEAVSPDGKTGVKIDYGTEQESKDRPELHLKLFDKIKADVVSDNGITLSAFDDEVKIEHTKGDSAKVTVFDSVFIVKNGKVIIDSGGKVYIGGGADNICALLTALVQELIDFQTFGPPPQHKTHPATVVKLEAFKNKIKALFMESV